MRLRAATFIFAGLTAISPALFGAPLQGASQAAQNTARTEGEGSSMTMVLLWANFLLLVGGLGYLAVKNGGPFFAERSRKIEQGMLEAAEVRKAAEARTAEAEGRLAKLRGDLDAIHAESHHEIKMQTRRCVEQTAAAIAKIQAHAEQEIAGAGKLARLELKRYSAELAVKLAGQKIRDQIDGGMQESLVRGFIRNIGHPASRAQTN